jgi:hypothetical protein
MTYHFKIKYGFGVADQVSVTEQEIEKAIYAQIKGVPVQLGSSYINGKNIISISPHYHKHTGWHDWYEPQNGSDFEQIKRDCPNYDGLIEKYKERVAFLVHSGREKEIGKNVPIPQLEMKTEIKPKELPTSDLANKMRISP